ncbi:MAG TPA: vitamin B12-dependent ribonucleotide reductase [Edaphobacter sp.]|uniref:vitamin B12-dependent ribonucleotide reductase n=1 Tax=Edaphobacter sp. TaxID=1934404 RepID=UPI002CF0E2CE|nr:vitamin B12-dependent ribonucleotide reductase [Edaphobacter sp.]HUZ96286.1 vitamin B12-dependent ribonucleotide reductase [Edaphobacter sp.]
MAHSTTTFEGLSFDRVLTSEGIDPLDAVSWEHRDAVIQDSKGNTVFEQKGVRVPASWSQIATNIVASKYLHGKIGTESREQGVDALIHRVVFTLSNSGQAQGYFVSTADAKVFEAELTALMVHQYAAFNSPVWFNVGCETLEPENQAKSWYWSAEFDQVVQGREGYRKPQCSACFINSVDDSMESILTLAKTEGMLFKWGSGTGTNFSAIRGSMESLSGGGTASGPLSFMRGYDAFAGVIKSGGKTRRAAKMAILDVDHPDIEDFITCKSREEKKAQALIAAGFDGNGPDSEAYASIFYQNANNSVRVSNEFMQAVENGADWELRGRVDGSSVKMVKARNLFHQIAEETWRCGDPGMQFDSTINDWHTCPSSGRINASNPCSEYMFLDDSACNLASLNLMRFASADGFDVELFQHAVRILIVAQDILVDMAGYPTEAIANNSHDYRPLGLGYANLGAFLMSQGLAYDSHEGRAMAAGITALMGGTAYRASAEIAAARTDLLGANPALGTGRSGAFPGFSGNREAFLRVIAKHRASAQVLLGFPSIPNRLLEASVHSWTDAERIGQKTGFRNAQVTVLAPTGTIGFMMDCDTTGIEPMLGVVVFKKLVGGGHLTLPNQAVRNALTRLGYSDDEMNVIEAFIKRNSTIEGAPGLRDEHLPVFDCAFRPSNGKRSIHWKGHVLMMAAVQPFLSGAISKTVNLPSEATADEIEEAYLDAWRSGLKAVAIYRDGSKSSQPVSANAEAKPEAKPVVDEAPADLSGPPAANRHRLQDERSAITHHFSIAGHEGYLKVGLYPNGQPGEIFVRMAKAGSTIAGMMECFGTVVSVSLQHGVPLKVLCDKLSHSRFEPSGWTGNEEIGYAKSIMDYLFRWMELRFLSGRQLPLFDAAGTQKNAGRELNQTPASVSRFLHDAYEGGDAPLCSTCGDIMVRNGSCYKCINCGGTSGCS